MIHGIRQPEADEERVTLDVTSIGVVDSRAVNPENYAQNDG